MNHITNQKINQVTEQTLVVGIDIAKRKHYACVVDERGRILQKSFPVNQSAEGFLIFYQQLLHLQQTHQKRDILVGFEPTGHYWMNLADFLIKHEIPYVTVNPMHVHKSKELDDNLQTKNDAKDALVIAKLMRDGRFVYSRHLQDVEAEIRQGVAYRQRIQEQLVALKNRMIRWTDMYFPEFQLVFKDFGKIALAVLEKTPFPTDIRGQATRELITLYKEVEGLRCVSSPKIKQLQQCAESSIGLTEGHQMARFEIQSLVMQYRFLVNEYEQLALQLEILATQLVDYEYLISIPGVGKATAVEILSEVGSFSAYQDPRQLIKLAGLTLRENSSGEHKGRKKISKRGRKNLRAALFRVILPLIRCNLAFRNLYEYYIERPVNPLRKKEAMVVLCSKLLKVAHGLCTKKCLFDAEKMKQDLTCLPVVA